MARTRKCRVCRKYYLPVKGVVGGCSPECVGKRKELKRLKRKSKRVVKAKKNDEFFKSPEWREVRYQALVQHGRMCQCCGAKPPKAVLHVDHIKPRSKYPSLALSIANLQILCRDCNLGKGSKGEEDFR